MISFPNAKINLGLNIVEKRADGFHNIETVFYPIQLCDTLEFVVGNNLQLQNSGITVDSRPEDNLVLKAYELLKKDFDLFPLSLHLHKKIPFGAGLGGGSADAAFMLKMLNQDFNLALSDNQLEDYARQLGSDCAFFIKNQPVFAVGKGDEFSPTSLNLEGYYLLLIKPPIHVATKEAYAQVAPQHPDEPLDKAILQPIETWKDIVVNDFEKSVFAFHPELAELKQQLYAQGAVYASMSGSGSSVFGIFTAPPSKLPIPNTHFQWIEALK